MSPARRSKVWVLVIALVLLHFVLHVGMGFGRGAPDLLTLALLLAVRDVEVGTAACIGLLFGLLEDALSVLAFGANSVAMTLMGIAGALTRDLFVGDSRLFVLSYFFVGKWMRDFVHWVMIGRELRPPFVEQVFLQGGLAALYVAAVGLVLVSLTGAVGEGA